MHRFWFSMHVYSGVQKSGATLEIWKNKYNKNIWSACCLSAAVTKAERGQTKDILKLMLIFQFNFHSC